MAQRPARELSKISGEGVILADGTRLDLDDLRRSELVKLASRWNLSEGDNPVTPRSSSEDLENAVRGEIARRSAEGETEISVEGVGAEAGADAVPDAKTSGVSPSDGAEGVDADGDGDAEGDADGDAEDPKGEGDGEADGAADGEADGGDEINNADPEIAETINEILAEAPVDLFAEAVVSVVQRRSDEIADILGVAGGGALPTPKGDRPAPTDPVAIPDGIVAHESLRDILDVLEVSDRGAMLVGPAGTGKSFIASQCAEILGIPFYALSCGQIPQDYKIEGYPTKDGYFVTDFLEAFENGGLWCADEIDNSHPATLVTMNTAISNGFIFAGGKRYDRHPDFRIVATANTFGTGPDAQYVGRSPLDFATLDRFRKVVVGYDENVERHQCETKAARFGVGRKELEDWIACWYLIRLNIDEAEIPVSATSRGLVDGVALISKGWSFDKIVKSEFGGLTQSIFDRITFGTAVNR